MRTSGPTKQPPEVRQRWLSLTRQKNADPQQRPDRTERSLPTLDGAAPSCVDFFSIGFRSRQSHRPCPTIHRSIQFHWRPSQALPSVLSGPRKMDSCRSAGKGRYRQVASQRAEGDPTQVAQPGAEALDRHAEYVALSAAPEDTFGMPRGFPALLSAASAYGRQLPYRRISAAPKVPPLRGSST